MNSMICDECGEFLVKSPSGALCPNGHGKIRRFDGAQLRKARYEKWRDSLPIAKLAKYGVRYRIADLSCRRLRPRKRQSEPTPKFIFAENNGQVWQFQVVCELESRE